MTLAERYADSFFEPSHGGFIRFVRAIVDCPGSWRIFIAFLVGLLLCSIAPLSRAAIITVGAEAGCSAANLSAAISLASATVEADEIRLNFANESNYTNTQLLIRDFGTALKGELSIVGGFSSCADTTPILTPVAVAGAPGNPIFQIDTLAGDSIVTLRNLILRFGGRGLVIEGNSTVTLDNTEVRSNSGPGITISGGADLVLGGASGQGRISNNTTSGFGGGIDCRGAGIEAINASISGNQANSGGGGGIYASSCVVVLEKDAFVSGNSAIDGGGIYADRGSIVVFSGTSEGLPSLGGNSASDDGGGLYAKNAGTLVAFINARVVANSAANRGGGIFVDENGTVSMEGTAASCRRPLSATTNDECSQLHGNELTSGNLGAAIFAGNGAGLFLTRTFIERNSGTGALIHVSGSSTRANLEGLSVSENDVRHLYVVNGGANMTTGFVSANGNTYACADPEPCDAGIAQLDSAASLSLHSSIYWPAAGVSGDGTGILTGKCLMVSSGTGLAGVLPNTTTGIDPLFVDPSTGNLRIPGNSPAVDYCDESDYSALTTDIDIQERGQDWPGNPDGSPGIAGGLFDLGMDELTLPEELFSDGFEA